MVRRSMTRSAPELSAKDLGQRLRTARQNKSWTIKQLAAASGCSESLLSKIENGKNLPSLPLLHKLVRVLESNIGWLFGDPPPERHIVFRAGQRPFISLDPLRRGEGITLERVIPYSDQHILQCNIHHIAEGGRSAGPITHEGEEVGYVLKGRVELSVDGRAYQLSAGDSFVFRSNLGHEYRNIGSEAASIIWVNTPPTF
ncbi:MAG: cupin domain-containing protein [Bauldia sp.]|nr:cupin domain-containing protein [Bauldia sp.]